MNFWVQPRLAKYLPNLDVFLLADDDDALAIPLIGGGKARFSSCSCFWLRGRVLLRIERDLLERVHISSFSPSIA